MNEQKILRIGYRKDSFNIPAWGFPYYCWWAWHVYDEETGQANMIGRVLDKNTAFGIEVAKANGLK